MQVSDFGHTPQGAGYLVMEFLRGVSLAKRIADLGEHGEKMEPAVALQIAWQVADALTVAHGVGIVHRDLKPENLMLIDDPIAPSGERVKILDFGIAKLTQSNTVNKAHTAVNALMGTPVYMSPEQCEGRAASTRRPMSTRWASSFTRCCRGGRRLRRRAWGSF